MPYTIEELRKIITPIAQAHGLRSVSLFGSYSKGTARRDSDVDLKLEKGSFNSFRAVQISYSRFCIFHTKQPVCFFASHEYFSLEFKAKDVSVKSNGAI